MVPRDYMNVHPCLDVKYILQECLRDGWQHVGWPPVFCSLHVIHHFLAAERLKEALRKEKAEEKGLCPRGGDSPPVEPEAG